MKRITALALIIGALFISGCAETLKVADVPYHKAASQYASLGSCGYIGATWGTTEFQPDSSNVQFSQPLKTTLLTVVTDDSARKAAVDASASAPKIASITTAGASAGLTNENDVSGKYNIVTISDDLPGKINAPVNKAVQGVLKNWGPKARIITSVAIAYNQSQTVKGSTSSEINATYSALTGKVSLSTNKQDTIKFSDGTVFAYEMSKVFWKKDSQGQVIVANVLPNRPGAYIPTPPGTTDDPATLK